MKIFNKLVFAVLLLVFVGYMFLVDNGSNTPQKPLSPSQPKPVQKAASQVPQVPTPRKTLETGTMTPPWPPSTNTIETLALDSLLTRKNFVLILDGSGSMNKQGCSGDLTKIEVAKQAVTEWSASVPDNANLGLIVFDQNDFSIRLPLGLNNRDRFKEEVAKVVADYKTPLTKSLNTAYAMLTEQGRKQLGYGEYTVVIVTDGVANDIAALEKSVDAILSISPVMIHTIGFCITSDHSLNRKGRTIYYAANNPASLRQGLQEVLAESESFDITGF